MSFFLSEGFSDFFDVLKFHQDVSRKWIFFIYSTQHFKIFCLLKILKLKQPLQIFPLSIFFGPSICISREISETFQSTSLAFSCCILSEILKLCVYTCVCFLRKYNETPHIHYQSQELSIFPTLSHSYIGTIYMHV